MQMTNVSLEKCTLYMQEFPVSDDSIADTFKAVVGALLEDQVCLFFSHKLLC